MSNHNLAAPKLERREQTELLPSILNSFEPISLYEMNNASLMDRVDSKYIFNQQQLPSLLGWLNRTYRVLMINERISTTYESVYFDTASFDLYRQHHNRKSNRYKIRYRNYVEDNLSFFEIKLKTNKGRTVKCRMPSQELQESIQGSAKEFLERKTCLMAANFHAVLWIKYKRITLVHCHTAERVTIDTDIRFKNKNGLESIFPLVVAEVKQEKSTSSEFTKLMKNNSIQSGFMSKYCFGISCLEPSLKKNNFKTSLNKFNKLQTYADTELD